MDVGVRSAPLRDDDHPDKWKEKAACHGMDPDLFYPGRGVSTSDCKVICRGGCPVRWTCLRVGIKEHFGVWGGYSERERRRLRRRFGTNAIDEIITFCQEKADAGREPITMGTSIGRPSNAAKLANSRFFEDDEEEARVQEYLAQERKLYGPMTRDEEERAALNAFFEDSDDLTDERS